MKISAVNLSYNVKKTGKNINNQTVSFKKSEWVSKDKFEELALGSLEHNAPRTLLHTVKNSDYDVKGVNKIFLGVVKKRAQELFLMQKQKEKELLEEKLQDAYRLRESAYLSTNVADDLRTYYIQKAKTAINNITDSLTQYKDFREPNHENFKIFGKVAKALLKKQNFNPNYKDSHNLRLITHTLSSGDDELSLMLMKHKDFERPVHCMKNAEWERFLKLEKQSKSLFSSIFG